MLEDTPAIVVGALILNKKNEIFLAKFPKWRSAWAIPAGKVKYGETLIEALKREILEETGLHILDSDFLRIGESICDEGFLDGKRHMVFIDFVCTKYDGQVVLDDRELKDYKWINLESALNINLTPATKCSIEALLSYWGEINVIRRAYKSNSI